VGNAHSLLIFGIPTNAHLFTSPHPLYPTVPQRSHLYNTILSNRASKEFTPVRPKPSRVLPKSKPPAIRTMLALSYSELDQQQCLNWLYQALFLTSQPTSGFEQSVN
jgi:hypothetical protein